MPVTEEVHFIYPENEWALNRIKDTPVHKYFKTFGEAMPSGAWNHPGTKQGVYMIGPNAEYLGGGGAISGNAARVTQWLQKSLKTWKAIAKKKKYANRKVPLGKAIAPPEILEKPLVFRVFLRDLPRGQRDRSGRRFEKSDIGGQWLAFTKWAWNTKWLSFDNPKVFVPKDKAKTEVDSKAALKLCRQALVDNVRGQNPAWRREHVQLAKLHMRFLKKVKGNYLIEYTGEAKMDSGTQSYAPKLYGQALWSPKKQAFQEFSLVAIGQRAGQGTFNQRGQDHGPAPLGIALVLH